MGKNDLKTFDDIRRDFASVDLEKSYTLPYHIFPKKSRVIFKEITSEYCVLYIEETDSFYTKDIRRMTSNEVYEYLDALRAPELSEYVLIQGEYCFLQNGDSILIKKDQSQPSGYSRQVTYKDFYGMQDKRRYDMVKIESGEMRFFDSKDKKVLPLFSDKTKNARLFLDQHSFRAEEDIEFDPSVFYKLDFRKDITLSSRTHI